MHSSVCIRMCNGIHPQCRSVGSVFWLAENGFGVGRCRQCESSFFGCIQWKLGARLSEISTGCNRNEVGAINPPTEQVYWCLSVYKNRLLCAARTRVERTFACGFIPLRSAKSAFANRNRCHYQCSRSFYSQALRGFSQLWCFLQIICVWSALICPNYVG